MALKRKLADRDRNDVLSYSLWFLVRTLGYQTLEQVPSLCIQIKDLGDLVREH